MLEMPLIGRDFDRTMFPQRVITLIGRNFQDAGLSVQIRVRGIAADRSVSISAWSGGGISHPPNLITRPKCWDPLFMALWVSEHHVQLNIIERIGIHLARGKRPFHHAARHSASRRAMSLRAFLRGRLLLGGRTTRG